MNAKASKPYQFHICSSWVTSAVLRNVILNEGPVTCEVVRNPHSASDSEAVLPCVCVPLPLQLPDKSEEASKDCRVRRNNLLNESIGRQKRCSSSDGGVAIVGCWQRMAGCWQGSRHSDNAAQARTIRRPAWQAPCHQRAERVPCELPLPVTECTDRQRSQSKGDSAGNQ